MWQRSRAARWFDSPSDSVLRCTKNGLNHNLRRGPHSFFFCRSHFFLCLTSQRPRQSCLSIFLFLFLPCRARLAGCDHSSSFCSSSQLSALWRRNSGVQDLSQISPDSGLSLIYEILSPSYSMSFFVSADQEMSFSCWIVLMLNWWVLIHAPSLYNHCGILSCLSLCCYVLLTVLSW